MDPDKGYEPEVFNQILPGVSGRRLPLIWRLEDPRIIHSHTTFRKGLPRAVYMIRDGRDAVVSFYHYTVTREGHKIPFPDWFELYSRRWYGARWHDHIESWLNDGSKNLLDNLLVVKFEEMKENPVTCVQLITKHLGLTTDNEVISNAIEMASLGRARERERREFGDIQNPNKSFYRGGKTGQWSNYLKGNIYERFMDMSDQALRLANYMQI
jgi:hypothetical protein